MPKTAPALTYGPGVVDWQERINIERFRRERAARLQGIMKRHGIASLLGRPPGIVVGGMTIFNDTQMLLPARPQIALRDERYRAQRGYAP